MTLITKYRPHKFEDVIGQEGPVKALRRALDKGTSRTFLLTGPTGLGKTSLARLGTEAVGCKDGSILEIDGATHTGIDDMRVIGEFMTFAPMIGDAKAIIIDEAHALSKAAIQSLLKTFEEPPEWGYWFMCTTEPTKIPATIKSRCLHLNLKSVSEDNLVQLLEKVCRAEKITFKFQGTLDLCAKEAQGSPRQALVNLAACTEAKSIKEAADMLQSATDNPQAYQLAQLLFKGTSWRECQTMLKNMKDLNGESVRQVIRAYMTSCALNIPSGSKLQQAIAILEAFEQPCNSQDGISPIVLSCARLLIR